MQLVLDLLEPGIIAGVSCYGMAKRVDVYDALPRGGQGLEILLLILPALVTLLTVVAMLGPRGRWNWRRNCWRPPWVAGYPAGDGGLMLVRPISGSAALGVGVGAHYHLWPGLHHWAHGSGDAGLHRDHLYTIAVYFGAAGIKKPGMRCRRPSVPIWRAFSLPLRCGCFWDNSGIGDGQGGFARGWLCVIMQESPMRGERESVGESGGCCPQVYCCPWKGGSVMAERTLHTP